MRERNKRFVIPSRRLKRVLLFYFLGVKRGLCFLEIEQMMDYIKKTSGRAPFGSVWIELIVVETENTVAK